MRPIDRREFLRRAAATGASALALAALDLQLRAQETPAPEKKTLELREFGATGRSLPRLGMSCAPLAAAPSDEKAIAVIARAYELGVRYFDTTAPNDDGRVETLVGRALKGAKREELWLVTKSDADGAAQAKKELAATLKRLGSDYVDAVTVPAMKDWKSSDQTGSGLDGLKAMVEQKLIRHLGITSGLSPGHTRQAFRSYPYAFATVPVYPAESRRQASFVKQFLPYAVERKIPVVAMQLFTAGRPGPKDKDAPKDGAKDGAKEAPVALPRKECIAYALAQRAVVVIAPACSTIDAVEEAFAATVNFVQPSDEVLRDMEARAAKLAGEDATPAPADDGDK